jgi:hypothetical protein
MIEDLLGLSQPSLVRPFELVGGLLLVGAAALQAWRIISAHVSVGAERAR